jgi:hypothetical protein
MVMTRSVRIAPQFLRLENNRAIAGVEESFP